MQLQLLIHSSCTRSLQHVQGWTNAKSRIHDSSSDSPATSALSFSAKHHTSIPNCTMLKLFSMRISPQDDCEFAARYPTHPQHSTLLNHSIQLQCNREATRFKGTCQVAPLNGLNNSSLLTPFHNFSKNPLLERVTQAGTLNRLLFGNCVVTSNFGE